MLNIDELIIIYIILNYQINKLIYIIVFSQIYMMPESSAIGELRIYRAFNFPLQWKLEKVILKKHMVDSVLIDYNGKYWIFGSDYTGFGVKKNGQMEIWYSNSPLGPWKPHKKNPIYNTDKSFGARNGGRPLVHDGNLYRIGQDCGDTYGRRVRVFRVKVLTEDEFEEVEVSIDIGNSNKGRNAWNGARHHHLDVQRLSDGRWIGVMDGDRVLSGDSGRRFFLGCASVMAVFGLVMLLGAVFGAVKCIIPINWCPHNAVKRSDLFLTWEQSNLSSSSSKLRQLCGRLNRAPSFLRGMVKPNTGVGRVVVFLILVAGAVQACMAVKYIFGGDGAEQPYPLKGSYSQFTLLTMTYESRLWNLKMYVKHYSKCASVAEIVVVWNKGEPPSPPSELETGTAVPVRVRTEGKNSLNNRFNDDPLIKNRAVLELDDDIIMSCDDIERGFRAWREHPDRIVGFYPRLAEGTDLKYDGERYARNRKGYNMILTGAAFIDARLAFRRYWSKEAAAGREAVDGYFNCEDVLMNYLYANASSSRTVEYVRPRWVIDTSKFSGVAISGNTQRHYSIRSKCLLKFSEMYGGLEKQKWEFDRREDGWDL